MIYTKIFQRCKRLGDIVNYRIWPSLIIVRKGAFRIERTKRSTAFRYMRNEMK